MKTLKGITRISAALAVVGAASSSFGAFVAATPTISYTAGTVSALDPGAAGTPPATAAPSGITDAASNTTLPEGTTLANFQTAMTAAYTANTGGVINFEEVDENGAFNNSTTTGNIPTPTFSWPSQNNSATNGLTFGNIPVDTTGGGAISPRAVEVNYGASQPTATQAYNGTVASTGDPGGTSASNTLQLVGGANHITLWRDQYTTNGGVPVGSTVNVPLNTLGFTPNGGAGATQTNAADGFDANNGENNSGATGVSPVSGNSYMGITNDATPVVLDFSSNPLSAFGITVVGRGSTRPLTVDITLADGFMIKSSTEAAAGTGTAAIFYGFTLTAADLATHGGIIYTTFDISTNNPDRFDDLAFIVAPTPEPATIGLLSVGGLALLRRRRTA